MLIARELFLKLQNFYGILWGDCRLTGFVTAFANDLNTRYNLRSR